MDSISLVPMPDPPGRVGPGNKARIQSASFPSCCAANIISRASRKSQNSVAMVNSPNVY